MTRNGHPERSEGSASRPRVLVVDDDRNMVRTLCDVLGFKGWQVGSAYSGEQAVDVVMRERYDVVLMDVKMPGMDGVDALRAIRERRPGTIVVLMTAYAAEERLAEAENAGVAEVLHKPVNIPAMMDLLADALNASRPVLLVDNDGAFLRTLSEVLELRGYHTVLAHSVEQATSLMAEKRPVAVLLHTRLGELPVHDAVERVHDVGPSVALILYSGRPEAESEIQHAVPGDWVRAYLQKPFQVEDVTRVLDAVRASG